MAPLPRALVAASALAVASGMVATAPPRVVLTKNIKTPDPIPTAGIAEAVSAMESGKLYRYNVGSAEESVLSRCEQAVADYTGHKYALGLNSCGSAIFLSLLCAGVQPGDGVLTNGFTFTAVPSAIVHAGAEPVYVEATSAYVVDLDDLERKIVESGARYFMVSHMRGKIADMDAVAAVCAEHGVELLEDCAHSIGVLWNGEHTGHHGTIASISSQSYKMLNSGEGGFLLTDDDDYMAAAMVYAGAYEALAAKHLCRPPAEAFARVTNKLPNFSLRMHEVTAAMILPQIATIDERREKYNERHYALAARLRSLRGVSVPEQLPQVTIVGDSIQFNVAGLSEAQTDGFLRRCGDRGLPVELFGGRTNARNFKNWQFAPQPSCGLPQTAAVIAGAFDVRMPLLFEPEDFEAMFTIIEESLDEARIED